MTKLLKGDPFKNRIRITGTLKTLSPLHIGTGETRSVTDESGAERKISTIVTDHEGKPVIPGSSLRGVMRHWLLHTLQGVSDAWASMPNRDDLLEKTQPEQISVIREEFSWLELLFGTPFNAGKIEVWDATCITGDIDHPNSLVEWDNHRLTYVDTSVVIDPDTGTAMDKLLYKADVVPPGVCFQVNITGQNLMDEELGLVLLALKGFNSQIYPIRVGARAGRGFGRMEFVLQELCYLCADDVAAWIQGMIQDLGANNHAHRGGYFALPTLDSAKHAQLIEQAKDALIRDMEG